MPLGAPFFRRCLKCEPGYFVDTAVDRRGPMVNEPKLDGMYGMCNESWGRHADFTVISWGFQRHGVNGQTMWISRRAHYR